MRIITLFIIFLITGCTTTLKVTYDSVPSGAILSMGNRNLGYAPVTIEYLVQKNDYTNGFMTIQAPTAQWQSGAIYSPQSPIVIRLNKSYDQEYLLYRPDNFPNREADAIFGLQLVKQRELNEQRSKAQNSEALIGVIKALTPPPSTESPQEPTRMHCNKSGETTMNCQTY